MAIVNRISYLNSQQKALRGFKYSTKIARNYRELFFYFKAFSYYEDPLFLEIQVPVKNPCFWSIFSKKG